MTSRRRKQGFALVTILVFTGILALIALNLTRHGQTNHMAALVMERQVQQNTRAQNLATLATAALIDASSGHGWYVDGRWREVIQFEQKSLVSIADESGKIDLNQTEPETLSQLFTYLGRADGANLAQLIVTSRQQSSVYGQNLFHQIEDIRRIPEIDLGLAEKVYPYLTVYSGQTQLDVTVSSLEVLNFLANNDPIRVETWKQNHQSKVDLAKIPSDQRIGRAYKISVKWSDHQIFEHVIRLTGNPADPFWVLRSQWRYPERVS